jgi:hypothetical protein
MLPTCFFEISLPTLFNDLSAFFNADPDEPPLSLRNGLHGPILFGETIETGHGITVINGSQIP